MRGRFIVIASALLVGSSLAAGPALAAGKLNSCKEAARAAFVSCQLGAQSDFQLARGKCLNESAAQSRRMCDQAAVTDRNDSLGDCQDQRDARINVCSSLGPDPYRPAIDPNDFSTTIDNPLLPMVPGTTYVYHTSTAAGLETDTVFVTSNTRTIMGVVCVEVHDQVSLDGVLTEDTLDWLAQDGAGNVWYFGENSKTLENGLVVDLEGSWEAGVDGAWPGILMKASPQVGDLYRQEFQLGVAEDLAEIVSLNESETVPYGSFTGLLKTREFAPLEPDANENKFYAPGIGVILEIDQETGDRTELISVTP